MVSVTKDVVVRMPDKLRDLMMNICHGREVITDGAQQEKIQEAFAKF